MHPQKIHRFEVRGTIGETDRATVLRAFDPQLGREVALKLLKSKSLYTPSIEKRFTREVEKLAALNHPNILPVYEFGEEDKHPFIVTPLMKESLADRLQRGRLTPKEVVDLFNPIADALDYAADQGILHRELKPSNILFDEHGHPFLSDLGLMQVVKTVSTVPPPPSNPAYVSPEQVRRRQLDNRSQVYSLAAVIYHALTGKPPFHGVSDAIAMFKQTSERPRPPSLLQPDLPASVDTVLLKALEKEPDERFPSAQSFLHALRRAISGEATPEEIAQIASRGPVTPPPSIGPSLVSIEHLPTESMSLPTGKRKLVGWLIVLSVFLSLCIGIGVAGWAFLSQSTGRFPGLVPTPTPIFTPPTLTPASESPSATQTAVAGMLSMVRAWPLLVEESFADNALDWAIGNDEGPYAIVNWEINGKYVWTFTAKQGFIWRVWPEIQELTDFYVTVEVQRISGKSDSQYGLIFRNNEETDDYYYFEVIEDGLFSVYIHYGGEWIPLIDYTSTDAIQPAEVNRLGVLAMGSDYAFFINDQLVGETSDNRLTKGKPGLIVGLYNEGEEGIIEFDNFVVRVPPQ